jgi:hypothetical protein
MEIHLGIPASTSRQRVVARASGELSSAALVVAFDLTQLHADCHFYLHS